MNSHLNLSAGQHMVESYWGNWHLSGFFPCGKTEAKSWSWNRKPFRTHNNPTSQSRGLFWGWEWIAPSCTVQSDLHDCIKPNNNADNPSVIWKINFVLSNDNNGINDMLVWIIKIFFLSYMVVWWEVQYWCNWWYFRGESTCRFLDQLCLHVHHLVSIDHPYSIIYGS